MFKNVRTIQSTSKLFLSCSDLKLVNWEEIIKYVREHNNPLDAQLELLQTTVFHPLNLSHPVKTDYQRLFLKKFIFNLESCGEEVCDSLYADYVDKLNYSTEPQKYHYKHFRINEKAVITLQESTRFVTDGTTGLLTWEGGVALAEWCLQHTEQVSGRHILELGCGLGLTGLSVCVACCPLSYTFTDCHPSVLSALEHNLQLNHSLLTHSCVKTLSLDWEEIPCLSNPVDVVIGADIVYDERIFPALVNTLHHFLFEKPTFAILACTERNSDTLSKFLQCLEEKDLEVEELECPLPRTFHYALSPAIRLFRCRHGREKRSSQDPGRS